MMVGIRIAIVCAAASALVGATVGTRAAEPEPDDPETPAPPETSPAERLASIEAELAAERYGSAVVLCEEAARLAVLTLELRASCGRAYVGLGDKLLAAGSPDNARKRWEEAVAIDPRLIDDPDFVRRLETTAPPRRKPSDKPPGAGKASEPKPRPLPKKPLPLPEERKGPPEDAGPRWDRDLGVGLSFGVDGLVALTVGWLADETLLAEVSFGLVYPAADVRVRWLGMRNCLTPYLGLGMLVPFGEDDRFGVDAAGYDSLYELGEAVHVDVGIAYTPVHRLDLFLGVAFVTPLDQDHPDTVLFFPQVSGGVSWFF